MHHFSDALYAHVLIAAARARSARVKSKDALAIIVYFGAGRNSHRVFETPWRAPNHPKTSEDGKRVRRIEFRSASDQQKSRF